MNRSITQCLLSIAASFGLLYGCANEDLHDPHRDGWINIADIQVDTEDPGTQTEDPGTQTEDPGTQTEDPGTQTEDPGTQTEDPGTQTEDPGTQTEDPGTQTEDPTSHTWAQPVEMPGLPNLFKVSDTVYRSAQPVSGGFESAEALGIRTILNLQLLDEDNALAQKEPTTIELVYLPMTPLYFPEDQIVQALQVISQYPSPVLVHCRHGADRTGLIIAFYRIIYEHWTVDEAKDELVNGGFGYHEEFEAVLQTLDDTDLTQLRNHLGL